MTLSLLLPACVAALTVLGTFLLALDDGDLSLPLVAVFVAVTSVYLTDHKRWFRLHPSVANLASIGAVGLAVYRLGAGGSVAWLMAVAHLLAYLQFVLLYQEKDTRHMWLIVTLSLFQVAVATALNTALGFGLMLTVYLLVALAAMTLLSLKRETMRHRPARDETEPSTRRVSHVVHGLQGNAQRIRFGWPFVRRVVSMGLACWMVAVLVFLLVPRLARTGVGQTWGQNQSAGQRMVGYSSSVNLNSLGPSLQNRQTVLQLWVNDESTGEALRFEEPLLIRGMLLTDYNQGQWRRSLSALQSARSIRHPVPADAPGRVVRQTIELRPLETPTIFGLWPWAMAEFRGDVLMDDRELLLARPSRTTSSQFRYEALTWGVEDLRQPREVAHFDLRRRFVGQRELAELVPGRIDADDYLRLTRMPEDPLPSADRLAREWVDPLPLSDEGFEADPRMTETAQRRARAAFLLEQYERIPTAAVRHRARHIEQQLALGGQFEYALGTRIHDTSIDPIEDFLANRKSGHCEYFAAAAAMMLRSQGIPTRVVVGFSCDEFNEVGQFYQVRQAHAHSWVECYLPGGRWLTLDPTPPSERLEWLEQLEPSVPLLTGVADYLESLWNGWVLGLDPDRQDKHVYRPLRAALGQLTATLADPDFWKSTWGEFTKLFQFGSGQAWTAWLNWQGVVFVVVVWNVVYLGRKTYLTVTQFVREGTPLDWQPSQRDPVMGLFSRLELLLARYEVFRTASQTAQSFAQDAATRLARAPRLLEVAHIPGEIVQAYYQARYGQQYTPRLRAGELEGQLQRLEKSLEKAARETADRGGELAL